VTGSIYLGDPGVDRHHLIIQNTHSRLWSTEFGGHDRARLVINFNAVIEQIWRCTWRPSLCELGGRNCGRLEIHTEAVIEGVWKCTWRLWPCELRDRLGAHDRANLNAVIVPVSRFTWRPSSCELGGRNHESLEIHLEAVIERVWRCTWRPWSSEIGGVLGRCQSGGSRSGGRRDRSWDSIHRLTCNCTNVECWVHHGLQRDEGLVGSGWHSIFGSCSTRCLQDSVYAVHGVWCTWCMLYLVYAVLGVCRTWC